MAMILDHSELGGLDAITTAEYIRAGGLSAGEAVGAAIDVGNFCDDHQHVAHMARHALGYETLPVLSLSDSQLDAKASIAIRQSWLWTMDSSEEL